MVSFYNKQLYIQMRRKCYKLREFSLNGAKANSTHIGTEFKKYFVVGDSANNTRLFDFQNDEQLGLYSNHSSNQNTQVTAVALGYYEKQIFSGTNRGMIHIWDMQTAKSTGTLKGSSPINCFGIFPQQPDMLASGSCDSSIKVWDIREKNATAVLKGHTKQVNSIAISPDGSMLLSGSQDNSNRLWDFRNIQRPIFISNEHNGPILRTRFNPEDCFFATSSMDKTVKYFRCEQKCFGFVSSTAMISLPPTGLCFSEDGKTLFTAANDVLKSWNMLKNGLLVQTFETNWKGVQDMTVRQNVVTAISFAGTTLNLWVCDLDSKLKNNSRTSQQGSFVLPKINRQGFEKGEFDLSELQNIVGNAIQKVNSIEDKPTRDRDFEKKEEMQKKRQEFQKKRQEMQKKKQEQIERKRSQMEKRREQMQKKKKQIEMEKQRQRQRILLQKLLKEKDQKQKKEQQRLKKLEQEKKEQERLYQERVQRQKLIQQRVKETFQNHNNTQNTQENDILQDSTLMRLSNYVPDRDQKQKLKQFELIEDIIKEKTKYECILLQRSKSIGPILSYWKNGKVSAALDMLGKVNYMIKLECITAILTTPLFKQGVSPEVGTQLTSMMNSVMITEKNSTFVKGAMDNINTIVLLFKDELIKIKTFNPMTRVDLSREERLAKYDRLIDQFLNVFKQQRLIKYYKKKKSEEQNNAFCTSAYVLYKNLEQVLIKILPKQEPQLA